MDQRAPPEDEPPASPSGDEPLAPQVDAALLHTALSGWEVRRVGANTWDVVDEREPSATWAYHYTVITFSSPSGVLVLHGNQHKAIDPTGERDQGTFVPYWGDAFKGAFDFPKRLRELLTDMFRYNPPNTRPLKMPAPRARPPAREPLGTIIDRLLRDQVVGARFDIQHPDPTTWHVVPRRDVKGNLDAAYVIDWSPEPEAALMFHGNGDGGPFNFAPRRTVIYVPRDRIEGRWIEWVLRTKQPNTYGAS